MNLVLQLPIPPIIVYLIHHKKECVQIIDKHIEANTKNKTAGDENRKEERNTEENKIKNIMLFFFLKLQTYVNLL